MGVIIGSSNMWVEREDTRELVPPQKAEMKSGEDWVFRWNGESGVLELSMSETDIAAIIKVYGGLPVAQMCVPAPFDPPIVQNVKDIRSLPRTNGTFFMSLASAEPAAPVEVPEPALQVPERPGFFTRMIRKIW